MCTCWSLHHLWFFLAGCTFCGALAHIKLHILGLLPLVTWGITITQQTNYMMIALAAALCVIFLYLGHKGSCLRNSSKSKCC